MVEARRGRSAVCASAAAALVSVAMGQPVGYDFNDDGFSDYPVSVISYDQTNPDVGAARIWSGASKSVLHTIQSTTTNTLFGWSYGSAGDLDADGKQDLVVGEPLWSATSDHEGRIQVFSGDDASALLTIPGPYIDAALGRYVTGIGDWNGDGTPDVASSGWDIADTDSDGIGDDPIGIVYVFSGVDGSVLTEITDPTATPGFGYAVFGLGDITGDGLADIAITDPQVEPVSGSGAFGQVYIFAGDATATGQDFLDAHRTIANTNAGIRGFAAQVDVMHPDLWLDEPTLQIVNLTARGNGGVNEAEISIDIIKADGTISGGKGIRPSLTLAGDVNLDGKVDALDLQDSISQLGTNPQAIGVMPIADSNNDNIIDAIDIQVVVDGYGQTTDVYEGLWDGSRLLAVAAGSSGFGSLAGVGSVGGGTQFGGGPCPKDDCPPVIIAPPDSPATLVPSLLREDARGSCGECPDYEDDPGCYSCDSDKGVSGGSVTASPAQPLTTETVTFTVAGVSETPGTLKCNDSCGDDGATVPTPLGDPSYVWQVLTKGENGWPEESDPNDGHIGWPSGTTVTAGGNACQEKKAICWAKPSSPCVPDPAWTRVGEKSVKWAEFRLTSEMVLEWPSPRSRTQAGPNERVSITTDPPSAAVTWSYSWDDAVANPIPGGREVKLPPLPGNYTVTATASSCERTIDFTVLEPAGIRYERIGFRSFDNLADAGQCLDIYILPDTVNFRHIFVWEGGGDLVLSDPPPDHGEHSMSWYGVLYPEGHPEGFPFSIGPQENKANSFDRVSKRAELVNGEWVPGEMYWDIELHWATEGALLGMPFANGWTVRSEGSVDDAGTVTIEKGGFSVTRGVNADSEDGCD